MFGSLSSDKATGVALKKGEEDPPILPDDQYPPWLFTLMDPQPTVNELQRVYETEGLNLDQLKRLRRYTNKLRINEINQMRSKK